LKFSTLREEEYLILDAEAGGFFVSAIEGLERKGIDEFNLRIYGQDSDPMAQKLTKMKAISK